MAYYQCTVQKPASVMVRGCISMGYRTFVKAPSMLNVVGGFGSSMLPSRQRFFAEGMAYFSKTLSNHILEVSQQHGSVTKVFGC